MKSPLTPLIYVLSGVLAVSNEMLPALIAWGVGTVIEIAARVTR